MPPTMRAEGMLSPVREGETKEVTNAIGTRMSEPDLGKVVTNPLKRASSSAPYFDTRRTPLHHAHLMPN